MPTIAIKFICIYLCCTIMQPSNAHAAANNIKDLFTNLSKQDKFSGVVLLGIGNQLLLEQNYGSANNIPTPNTSETTFRIGGVTRIFTATIASNLAAQEKINLDAPISQYITEANLFNKITMHQLLSNTSGIPDYMLSVQQAWRMKFSENTNPPNNWNNAITKIVQLKPQFEAGSKFELSTSNYMLIGEILARASKDTQKNIFSKMMAALGLNHTGFIATDVASDSLRAAGFEFFNSLDPRTWIGNNKRSAVEYRQPEWDFAASGLFSNAVDLYKFTNALMTDKLITPAAKKKIFTKHIRKNSNTFGGYGWEILEQNNQTFYIATGAHPGFYAFVIYNNNTKEILIVLSNYGEKANSRKKILKDIIANMAKN